MFGLAFPWALLGLAALPALAALYWLRRRFRRVPVSSLMLWRHILRPREGGRRFEQVSAPLTFFLEALALLLLIAAAADPRRPRAEFRRPLIAVLDDSASMRARRPGGSPRERAERALENAARSPDVASVRLIVAGVEPRALEAVAPKAWRRGLTEWTCRAPEAALGRAIALAYEIGRGRARILVLTDRAPETPPESADLQWLAFGTPLPNAAIITAARSAGERRDRVVVEFAAYGDAPMETRATIRRAGATPEIHVLRLDPAAPPRRMTFELPANAGDVEVALDDDALEEDNRGVLLPAPRAPIRVRLDLRPPLRDLVARAIIAGGRGALVETPDADMVIADTEVVGRDAADWMVRFDTAAAAASYTGPFVTRPNHPLLQGLSLEGAIWGARPLNDAAGEPLLFAGDLPLIAETPRAGGRRELRIAYDPSASDLHRTPNWPALFWNLLDWRADERPGPAEINGRAGGDALVRARTASGEIIVREPDGDIRRIRVRNGRALIPTANPGVYTIEDESGTYRFARNFFSPEESDLRAASDGAWGGWTDAETRRVEYASSAALFGLAALGALALHSRLIGRTSNFTRS